MANQEVRDPERAGPGLERGRVPRLSDPLVERVIPEEVVGEVRPLQVVGVPPRADEPDSGVGRERKRWRTAMYRLISSSASPSNNKRKTGLRLLVRARSWFIWR